MFLELHNILEQIMPILITKVESKQPNKKINWNLFEVSIWEALSCYHPYCSRLF